MKITKSTRILAALCVMGAVSPAFADVTQLYTFETVAPLYWADSTGFQTGGGQDIAGNYANLYFSPGVQAIHGSSLYPTTSGVLQIENANTSGTGPGANGNIGITLGSLANNVSFWYDTALGFTVTGYNALGVAVTSTYTANPNTLFATGAPTLATLNDPNGEGIASIVITDDAGSGGFTTIDNLAVSAPDATSTAGLLALAAAGMLAFRRKVVTQ